jgi:Thioredoxin domain-containing protein
MENFEEFLLSTRPVLVEFYADWSESCTLMDEELQLVKEWAGERVIVMKKDVEEYAELIERYAIRSIPTLLLFKEGKIIWRKNGFAPAREIMEQLTAVLV